MPPSAPIEASYGAGTVLTVEEARAVVDAGTQFLGAPAVGGPDYLRLLRDPLPEIPLVPTGAVRVEDSAHYLTAGAFAVGIGGQLIGDSLAGEDLDALRFRARRLVEAIAAAGGDK